MTALKMMDVAQLRRITGLEADEPLEASTACVEAVVKKKHEKEGHCVTPVPRIQDCTRQDYARTTAEFYEGPTRWRDYRQIKSNPKLPHSKSAATGEKERTDDQSKSAWVQAKLNCLPDGESGSALTRPASASAANAVTSCGDPVGVERLWHSYFKNPAAWWDNRHDKLHPKSADFRHKITKEALWIESWNTPQWVVEALGRKSLLKRAGGSNFESGPTHDERRSEVPDSKSPQHDELSWTALISRHTKSGQGRQALRIYKEMREVGVEPGSYTYVAALKACSSLQDLESARQIHAEVVKCGLESDVYVGTMLVDVYGKCGSLVNARNVFEKMPHRNVVSWNAMITGYAQMEKGEEALQLYARMQQEGVSPNDRTFVGALKACSSLTGLKQMNEAEAMLVKGKCLEQVRNIHRLLEKSGCESDVFVGTMLVDVYAKCGSLVDARRIFEKMPHRNVVSWNAIILGYAQMEKGEEALALYARMQRECFVPDDRTFVAALKACSTIVAVEQPTEADWMQVKNECLLEVRAIHLQVAKRGFESDLFVGTMLVDVYCKCGSLVDARHIFEKMPKRNVVSWTAMILGYAQMEEGEVALEMYSRMRQEGVGPDDRTFVGVLKAYSSLAASEEASKVTGLSAGEQYLQQVKSVHQEIRKSGLSSDVYVGNMLVDAYGKCRSLVDARCVFERMLHRNVISWTAMILGYAQMEEGKEALELYAQMQEEGVVPDIRTFIAVLKACNSLATSEGDSKGDQKRGKRWCLEQAKTIHSQILKSGCESNLFLGNMLVDLYVKCRSLVDARSVFDKMPHKNVVSWTSLISGYAQIEEGEVALELYVQMQKEGVVPDARAFVGVLRACGSMAGLEKGKEIHGQILETEVEVTDAFVASSLIDMYSKCGSMVDAHQVFDALPTRCIVTWSALIAGYSRQGENDLVFDMFETMLLERIQPEIVTFLCVLTACSHAGLVDKGQKYFEAMRTDYGIEPRIEHYTCMIDLFGRAGQVDKAMEMAKTMPFQADGAVWRTVLSGCRKWRKVELGRQAFEFAMRVDPNDAASYVLMSNIYAAARMAEDAEEIQAMRVKTGAWKKPGHSCWTDMAGSLHLFVVGDQEHPESQVLHEKLEDLFVTMKDEGYVHHYVNSVLRDTTDDVKEDAISERSEKLAIAHALLRTHILIDVT